MTKQGCAEVIRKILICIPRSQLFMIIYIVMKTIKAGALQHNSLLHMSHLAKSALFIQQNAAWNAVILMRAASKADFWKHLGFKCKTTAHKVNISDTAGKIY